MAPRKCEVNENSWKKDLTKLIIGIAFAVYMLIISVLLSWVYRVIALPETLQTGIWLTVVLCGAPLSLTQTMLQWGIERGLRALLSIVPLDGDKEK